MSIGQDPTLLDPSADAATAPTVGVSSASSEALGGRATAPTLPAEPPAEGTPARRVPRPGSTTTGRRTVLPEVQQAGEKLVLVPRDRARYETRQVLGAGGMGEVELAKDLDIDRLVAVKRLHDGVAEEALARFVDEVRIVGKLEHPNIAPIHDVGRDDDGTYYFVMKYVEGETLEDLIERLAEGDEAAHRRYPFDRRVGLILGVLRALTYAHDRGLLHRDIKPANVMIGPYGEVMLMDWGIARPIGGDAERPGRPPEEIGGDEKETARAASTRVGGLIGTPLYMSPEQAEGKTNELDARSDLYSAALVFFELLTLRHPLEEETSVPGILRGVLEKPPPKVTDAIYEHPTQGSVPAEWQHFFRRALSKDPDGRPGSADAMVAEIEAIRSGDFDVQCPITAMKQGTLGATRFIDRHHKIAMLGGMAAAAAVLVSIAFGLWGLWVALGA